MLGDRGVDGEKATVGRKENDEERRRKREGRRGQGERERSMAERARETRRFRCGNRTPLIVTRSMKGLLRHGVFFVDVVVVVVVVTAAATVAGDDSGSGGDAIEKASIPYTRRESKVIARVKPDVTVASLLSAACASDTLATAGVL